MFSRIVYIERQWQSTYSSEKEKRLQERLQALLSVMTDPEADRLLAYAEGMHAAVALAAQAGA